MKCNLLFYLFVTSVSNLHLSHSLEVNSNDTQSSLSTVFPSINDEVQNSFNDVTNHKNDVQSVVSQLAKEKSDDNLNKNVTVHNSSLEGSSLKQEFLLQIHQDGTWHNNHNRFIKNASIYSVLNHEPNVHSHHNSVEIITLTPKITSNARSAKSFNDAANFNGTINAQEVANILPKSFTNKTIAIEKHINIENSTTEQTAVNHVNSISIKATRILPNVTVRKCCDTSHFFSLLTSSCEPTNNDIYFQSTISKLLSNVIIENVTYKTGTLKACPETNEPPSILSDVTNSTHTILSSGNLMDNPSQHIFSQDEYCLELVGAKIEEAALTLAFCIIEETEFYDYSPELETEDPLHVGDGYQHIVRKCCGQHEYYSTKSHKCTVTEDAKLFPSEVQQLSFEAGEIDLKIISSRIHECPDRSVQKKISSIDSSAYRLLHTGDLIEVKTGLHHNYSYYCLEMVGPDTQELSFTIALCSKSYEIPKCCPTGKYFDEIQLDCLPLSPKNKLIDLKHNYNLDSETYSVVPVGHFLICQNTFPVQETAENLYISEGKLCNSIACFEKEEFCIDYIGRDINSLQARAFYCQKEYFIKCCKEGHILSERGCTPHNKGKSVLLEHLTNTRNFVNSFDSKVCRKNKGVLLDQALASYVIWWVSNDGSYLTISAEPNKKNVHNYCVDDFIGNDGKIGPGAFVCESDVNHLLPNEHHFLRYSDKGSLGKCCPENLNSGNVFHFSSQTGNCEVISYNESLKDNVYLKEGSFVKEHFHDFPECPTHITGYHSFPFEPGTYDHAEVSSKGVLKIISMDGKCITREDIVEDRDYCIEYMLTSDGKLKPAVFLCAYAPIADVYKEKFTYITTLLGISCFFLFLTLIYLCTVRVRRGFVTVRKVNTLAGRILVSFIASHLIGFVAFTMTQHENSINKEDTRGCYILAGFVQFFNLATFCWNTSICLESLLLTIDISISKLVRYLLHSLWAWGFPLVMTVIMYLMDYFREELPCSFITPKIGVSYCFHSDNDSKLVYFYIPILFTLIANVAFIFGAKAMRKSRLKRLEKGTVKGARSSRTDTSAESAQVGGNTGMRTHQNQNSKAESLRIVLWTGGSWFLELAGFILTRYIFKQKSEKWYEYLWYIPTGLNALRGFGIFLIIVLTPEKRRELQIYLKRTKIRLRKLYKAFKESKETERSRRSTQKSSFGDDRKRNMSVTTMISNLSFSFYNNSSVKKKPEANSMRKISIGSYISSKFESLRKTYSNNNEPIGRKSSNNTQNNKPMRKFGVIRSVSQLDRRASSSSGNSFTEELEMEENLCRRKCSIPMPKLQEEESCLERGECTEINMEEIKEIDYEEEPEDGSVVDTVIVHSEKDSEERKSLNLEERDGTAFLKGEDSIKITSLNAAGSEATISLNTEDDEETTSLSAEDSEVTTSLTSDVQSNFSSEPETFVSRIEIDFEKSEENFSEDLRPVEVTERSTVCSANDIVNTRNNSSSNISNNIVNNCGSNSNNGDISSSDSNTDNNSSGDRRKRNSNSSTRSKRSNYKISIEVEGYKNDVINKDDDNNVIYNDSSA